MNEWNNGRSSGDGADETDDVYELEDTGEDLNEVLAQAVAAEEQQESGLEPHESAEELRRLREENAALREETDSLRDQALRARADFDNFRRRSERDKTDHFRYALGGILQELLAVVDNFERALAAEGGGDEFRTGVEMIHKQLVEVLQKAGLREVESAEKFDPTMHEAVMREEREDVPANTILQTLQKGYFLHDRLLRPAMVKVAVGGPERRETDEG